MSANVEIRPYRAADLPALHEITTEAFDGVSIDQIIERRYGLLGESDWKARKAGHIDDDVQRDVDGMAQGFADLTDAALRLTLVLAGRVEWRVLAEVLVGSGEPDRLDDV